MIESGEINMSVDIINLSLMIVWLIFIWFTKKGIRLTEKLGKYGFLSSVVVPLILLAIGSSSPSIYSGVLIIVIGAVIINGFEYRKQKANDTKS